MAKKKRRERKRKEYGKPKSKELLENTERGEAKKIEAKGGRCGIISNRFDSEIKEHIAGKERAGEGGRERERSLQDIKIYY